MTLIPTPIISLSLGTPNNPTIPPPIHPTTTRRRALVVTVSTIATALTTTPTPSTAATPTTPPVPLTLPRATALVTLNLSINRSATSRPLRIELYGDETPASVAFFASLASGTLRAPCAIPDTTDGIDATSTETCLEYKDKDVGYSNSQVWRLVPDRRIDFGRVDSIFAGRIPPTIPVERRTTSSGAITPSTGGAVSIRRGGGAFEFTIAPPNAIKPNNLAKEDLVVVGKVLDGEDMAFLEEMYGIPTRKDIVGFGDVPPLGDGNLKRACEFTTPSKTCAQFKPLKRIVVVGAEVVALGEEL